MATASTINSFGWRFLSLVSPNCDWNYGPWETPEEWYDDFMTMTGIAPVAGTIFAIIDNDTNYVIPYIYDKYENGKVVYHTLIPEASVTKEHLADDIEIVEGVGGINTTSVVTQTISVLKIPVKYMYAGEEKETTFTIPAASTTLAGVMTAADKKKLDTDFTGITVNEISLSSYNTMKNAGTLDEDAIYMVSL